MPEKPKDEEIPYETHLDLIERELNAALKNIEEMRSKQSEAKARFQVLKAAMGGCSSPPAGIGKQPVVGLIP